MSRRPSLDDDIPVVNSWVNRSAYGRSATSRRLIDESEAYMEANRLYGRVALTPRRPQRRIVPLILRIMGLGSWDEKMGLSKEMILEHLRVTKRKVDGRCEGEEADSCAICLDGYKKKEMIGSVECGHHFHAECIKGWLLRKNVCPLCKAIALRV